MLDSLLLLAADLGRDGPLFFRDRLAIDIKKLFAGRSPGDFFRRAQQCRAVAFPVVPGRARAESFEQQASQRLPFCVQGHFPYVCR
jgi:hypothetical protein